MKQWLTIRDGGGERCVLLKNSSYTIGFGGRANIANPHIHAVVYRLEALEIEHFWVLKNLDDTHGTAINGKPVTTQILKNGDVILIVECLLVFTCEDTPEPDDWTGALVPSPLPSPVFPPAMADTPD